jgi:hypothetical protein
VVSSGYVKALTARATMSPNNASATIDRLATLPAQPTT